MNNAWYLSLMGEVVIDAAEYAGWPMSRADEYGLAYFAREHRIEYLRPALLGEELRITTYLGEVGESRAARHYLINLDSGRASRPRADGLGLCGPEHRPARADPDGLAAGPGSADGRTGRGRADAGRDGHGRGRTGRRGRRLRIRIAGCALTRQS